jgi:ribose 5-phosphate isomerase A
MPDTEIKRIAARAALQYLPQRGVLGLGTGSTTRWFIEAVGELVQQGRDYQAVPTSQKSRELAQGLGIPLLDDAGPWSIDVCVDGADEVSRELDLIKGAGGAHTREKIVNFCAKLNVIIVDDSKLSERLGEKRRLPLEVLPFGLRNTLRALESFGAPELRLDGSGPFRSDSGNFIVDLALAPVTAPAELDRALRAVPGVVETGLFVGRADIVVVAAEIGVQTLRREG